MHELNLSISRARRRMRFQRFAAALVGSLTIAFGLMALVLVGQKLRLWSIPGAWWLPAAIALWGAVSAAGVASLIGGPTRLDAALAIDHCFGLGERLSTAVCLTAETCNSAAGRALLIDAQRHAADLDIAERFAVRKPRWAWAPLVPALLAWGVLALPEDLIKRPGAPDRKAAAQRPQEKQAVERVLKSVSQTLAQKRQQQQKPDETETGKLLAELEQKLDLMSKSPPADKQQALVELNKLVDQVQERRKQVGSPEQISRQLEQMKELASGGPAEEFARDLAKGDFDKAITDLKKLQEKMASNQLTESEKQELAKQLGELKKQLEQMANLQERRNQLEEARKKGMLSEQQYQQQKQKLEEQARNLKGLQQLAQKLGDAQQQLAQGNAQQAAQALQQAEQQVAEMAQQLQQMESLDAALADLQDAKDAFGSDSMNQLGRQLEGMNSLGMGMGNMQGTGMGLGRGRGQGDRPEAPDNTAAYDSKVRQQITKGKAVVGGFANPARQVRGESVLEVQGTAEAAANAATEALSDQKIPNAIKRHVQGYFDQVRKGE